MPRFQIRSRKLLYDLCLVDKLFNDEFSPYLYRTITVETSRDLASLISSDYLHYVKCFEGFVTYEPSAQRDDLMPKLVAKLPNLKRFV